MKRKAGKIIGKRIGSLLLCATLVLGSISTNAYAEAAESAEARQEERMQEDAGGKESAPEKAGGGQKKESLAGGENVNRAGDDPGKESPGVAGGDRQSKESAGEADGDGSGKENTGTSAGDGSGKENTGTSAGDGSGKENTRTSAGDEPEKENAGTNDRDGLGRESVGADAEGGPGKENAGSDAEDRTGESVEAADEKDMEKPEDSETVSGNDLPEILPDEQYHFEEEDAESVKKWLELYCPGGFEDLLEYDETWWNALYDHEREYAQFLLGLLVELSEDVYEEQELSECIRILESGVDAEDFFRGHRDDDRESDGTR